MAVLREARWLWNLAIPLLLLTSCQSDRTVPDETSVRETLQAFLTALTEERYVDAYGMTTLDIDQRRMPPTAIDALGIEHFTASYESNPVTGFDFVAGPTIVTLTRAKGSETVSLNIENLDEGPKVRLELRTIEIVSESGLIPGMKLDGADLDMAEWYVDLVEKQWRHGYRIRAIGGLHEIHINPGPVTHAMVFEAESGKNEYELELGLSKDGREIAQEQARAWLNSEECQNTCSVGPCVGLGKVHSFDTQDATLGASELLHATSDLGKVPQRGWAIRQKATAPTTDGENIEFSFFIEVQSQGGADVDMVCK